MKTKLFILDSGAFSVWNKGGMINFQEYVDYCKKYPDCSYYVNLDVIPGVAREKRSITPEGVEESCKKSWENYRHMLAEGLPKSKVIPVYHQNDPIKWLDKYLDFGSPYIGISPANDHGTNAKLRWMKTLRKYLFDGAGRPVVKTHGFAVTSYDLMKFWDWYSVDSASWKLFAAWGSMYLPRVSGGGDWRYDIPPFIVSTSPMSKAKGKRQHHVESMSPGIIERVRAFLDSTGVPLGTSEIIQEKEGYKLNLEADEIWFDKKKVKVLRPIVRGVTNSFEMRAKVNAIFTIRSNPVLPVKHIYFAGAPMPYPLEFQMGRRLLSYFEIGRSKSKRPNKYMVKHMKMLKERSKQK